MRSLWLWAGLALAVDGTPFQEEGTVDREQANTRIPDAGQIPPHLIEVAAKVAQEPLPVRLEAVSEALLGRPYLIDPLGEGFGIDPDPLARYDAFDCLTFVEELLALVMAGDPTLSLIHI